VGAAAIFVPFPHAVDDHQTRNAQFLVDGSAAWLLPQAQLQAQALAQQLQALDRSELLQRAEAAKRLQKTEATERVVLACEELIR